MWSRIKVDVVQMSEIGQFSLVGLFNRPNLTQFCNLLSFGYATSQFAHDT